MPAVSSIHWPQAHEACLAKCNFRSHWLTTVVHELVNKPYITPSSHSGLPGFWFVASDLWNTFPSHSGTAFPAFRASHGFTPSKKASLRITTIQPTFDTSSTWACVPGGEPKGAQAGVCWRAAVLGSWASCICTQASPVAASLGLTEQVRNEHRWWPDFSFPLEDIPWLLVSWRCGTVFPSLPVQKSYGTLSQEQQGPLLEPRYKKIPSVLDQIS